MNEILEKRTWDRRTYAIDCTKLLDASETILSAGAVSADQGSLVFGAPMVNTAPVAFPDGSTAAIGKAVQLRIDDGTLPAGVVRLNCTVRIPLVTTQDPRLEATVILRLTNDVF